MPERPPSRPAAAVAAQIIGDPPAGEISRLKSLEDGGPTESILREAVQEYDRAISLTAGVPDGDLGAVG